MDYDQLREIMLDGISDAVNATFNAWCSMRDIEPDEAALDGFYADELVNSEIIEALESSLNDRR